MKPQTRTKFDMLKKKVGAKTDNQLIRAMVETIYFHKMFEEVKEKLK